MNQLADQKIKVLFIPRWYPDKTDPMSGLFIRHLAESLTGACDVTVFHVISNDFGQSKMKVTLEYEEGIQILRIFYKTNPTSFPLIAPLLKIVMYYMAYRRGVNELGPYRPDLIHAHVLTRNTILAWLLSLHFKVPFLISEHWSRYYPESGNTPNYFHRLLINIVVRRSKALVCVSLALMKALESCRIIHPETIIIGNIIDNTFFIPRKKLSGNQIRQILHVSCFDDKSKNITGFLHALHRLSQCRNDFNVFIVGDGVDFQKIKTYIHEIGLNENFIKFAGLLTGQHLVHAYHNSDFLVQSSVFETFGTVVVEALVSGLPVVATRTGIAAELITPERGILIDPGDDVALFHAMNEMLDSCMTYDPELLQAGIWERFSREAVSRKMIALYKKIIWDE